MEVIIIITSIIATLTTYYLSKVFGFSKVLASALPSFIVALVFHLQLFAIETDYANNITLAFFGATFCGMTGHRLMKTWYDLILTGFLFGILFLLIGKYFKGFGGGLGVIACISVITYFVILKTIVVIHQLRKREKVFSRNDSV